MSLQWVKGVWVAVLVLALTSRTTMASHCQYNITEVGQVIDVDASQGVAGVVFQDIGAIHVDGGTEEDRLKECVEICCNAGADCNVVSLDKTIVGEDGDNCELYKCDPPEKCQWKIDDTMQSAIVAQPVTKTALKATTTDDTATAKTTTTATSKTTTTGTDSETTRTVSKTTTNAETTTNTQTTTGAETATSATTTTVGAEVPTTTTASSTSESDEVSETADIGTSSGAPDTTTTASEVTTPPIETTTQATTTTTTETPKTREGETPMTEVEINPTALPVIQAPSTKSMMDTTIIVSSTNTSMPPTESTLTPDFYDEYTDDDTSPSERPKTAGMSRFTVIALALAMGAGVMFIGVLATIVGKRTYDNWHRRHYQQIDYLVDGIYR